MGEKDLFYDLLANPQLALGDLEAVGHSTENSRLFSKDFYKNNEKVRAEFTKEDGTFDEKAFDLKYAMASYYWKGMTDDSYNKNLIQYTSFDKDNIFVDNKYRTLNTAPIITRGPNVTRDTQGLVEVGHITPSGKTVDEVAQAELVLLNPTEVEKGAAPIWGESPNDEWWSNPFSTRVLAKYDSAGYHTDAITGEKTWHEKDELKINSNGTHYYEALDGRSIYGRLVLNKFNTLTTDGSWWNQYDFLDSDDLNLKSVAGSIAKNLALVGSMFIPYVGWGIAAASVLTQMSGLTGTFGKMLTGSENSVFSEMEGFAKSWNRQGAKTQYAQQNMMCWENFIDLIGDTTAQLREQRAIFKFVPAIFKGKYGAMGEKGKELFKEAKMDEFRDLYKNKSVEEVIKRMKNSGDYPEFLQKVHNSGKEFEGLMSRAASKELENYLTSYNKIGEKIARAYMVGITVGDTYGEAKAAGATDAEAMLLTAGYAAAENALLSTDLGRWIFPELKGEKLKYKSIAKAFASLPEDVKKVSVNLRKLDKEVTKDWMKRLFNAGKEAAKKDYSLLNKTTGNILANGLGEGVEEVSEELLADFSKACFNTWREITGENALLDTWGHNWDWNEAAKRYGMSFFGGVIGGGINAAATDFDQIKGYGNMTGQQAMEHLTWMARNNELGDFWNTVNKMELGNSKLGTKQNSDGSWAVGTKSDNLDLEVKRLLKNTIQRIQDIVNVEGANLDDASFINSLLEVNPALKKYDLLGLLRTEAIALSTASGKLVKKYNTLIKNIVNELKAIDAIYSELKNDSDKLSTDLEERIKKHTDNITKLRLEKDAIMKGDYTPDLIRRSIFEATYQLTEGFTHGTEYQYVKHQLEAQGKDINNLTGEEKLEWHKKYVNYAKSDKADDIEAFADWYWDIALKTSKGILDSMDYLEHLRDKQLPNLQLIQELATNSLTHIQYLLNNGGEAAAILEYLLKLNMSDLTHVPDIKGTVEAIETIKLDPIADLTFNLYELLLRILSLETDSTEKENILVQIDEIESNFPAIKTYRENLLNKTPEVSKKLTSIDKLLEKVNNIFLDSKYLLPSERAKALRFAVFDTIIQDVLDTVEEAKKEGFIHPETKNILTEALNAINGVKNPYDIESTKDSGDFARLLTSKEWDDYLEFMQITLPNKISDAKNILKSLNSTPILQILNNFTTSLQTNKTVNDILTEALGALIGHKKDLENITLDEPTLFDYELALKVLELVRLGIIGARTDAADFGNLFGYNKTLNDLYSEADGYQKLAEIDKNLAEYALLDINLAIQRLQVMRDLHEVNSGNKLNAQNQAAVNKSLIMYNRVNRLITSIRDDDDKEAIRTDGWDFSKIEEALELMKVHKASWGDKTKNPHKNVSERKLNLGKDDRIQLEKESIILENALYEFFNDNIEKVKDPTKLAKILNGFNYFNINSGILNRDSLDIDDNAFTWWLASRAALHSSDYSAIASRIIDGSDVEKPIAPIPTQELGIYAGVAAIFNGDMFKYFADAITQSIYDRWKNMSPKERKAALEKGKLLKIVNGKYVSPLHDRYSDDLNSSLGSDLLPNSEVIYNSDLIPNYVNILFIEGIAGSGKSTGCFRSIMRILDNQNPELAGGKHLSDFPIFFAHGSKKNADDAVADFGLFNNPWNFRTFDKKELFGHFTDDYKEEITPDGEHKYVLGEDVVISNHRYKSNWKIKNFSNPDLEVPKIMFIDEWSHYTLPEIAFLQQVSDQFGIQIIAGGDLDQITPRAVLYNEKGDFEADMTIDRNSFPRMQKLGVSMRTGNGLKTENQNRVRAWENNKNLPIELMHLEVEGLLFGDKVYRAGSKILPKLLEEIKQDIQKMVSTLSPGEKAGYIWHNKESALYKLISTLFKDNFDFYEAKDAQGREARYYVVENNRDLTHEEVAENGKKEPRPNNPDDYFRAFYTGLTRSSQGSIIIAPEAPIGNKEMGTIEVLNARNLPTKLIPDGYSAAGLKKYTLVRKESTVAAWEAVKLEKGFTETIDLVKLTYIPRDTKENNVTPDHAPTAAEKLAQQAAPQPKPLQLSEEPPALPSPETTLNPPQNPEPAPEVETTPEPETPEVPEVPETPTGGTTETPETPEGELGQTPTILPRGTELYTSDGQFMGAVGSYNEETNEYSITKDGENFNSLPLEEMQKALDNGTTIMDADTAKIDGTVKLLALDEVTPYLGEHPIGTDIYDGTTSELIGKISDFDGTSYIVTKNGVSTTIDKNLLEVPFMYSIGKRPSNLYKEGDVFLDRDTSTIYTVTAVIPLRKGGYSYELKVKHKSGLERTTTFLESTIQGLEEEGYFIKNPEENSEDLELNIETGSQLDYEQAIEETLAETPAETEGTPEEKVKVEKRNIKFGILGHTFNTFYTGLTYENTPQGKKLKVPLEGEPGFDRIDMGFGLYHINPEYCQTEQQVVQILGGIRSAAMFLKENNNLIKVIKTLLPDLKNDELEIKYAWISKAKNRKDAEYAQKNDRFTPASDGVLRNMPEGDENQEKKLEVPTKAFSLIIRRKGDNEASLLEIPMITLSSPQTILYKIGQLDPTNGAYKAYIDTATSIGPVEGLLYAAIKAVMKYINDNKNTLGDGYQKLNALCKMWLFTNDGIRFVGGVNEATFNFARAFENLGVRYVKERTVEAPFMDPNNPPKNNYLGRWHSLSQEAVSRPEVLYSSIMMSTKLGMTFNGKQINVAAPGHPFVLRYEAPSNLGKKTDKSMMEEYLNQLIDPTKPKRVKLEYVSPPECSVSEYLAGIKQLENNPYGNSFSPYHILSIIHNYAKLTNNPKFWDNLLKTFQFGNKSPEESLAYLNQVLSTLDSKVTPPNPEESHGDYITRITLELKEVMKDDPDILPMLNDALFKIAFPKRFGTNEIDLEWLTTLEKICTDENNPNKLTGILRKKLAQPGKRVAGYAVKLVVDSTDKFNSPEGKPWRIFSKFDSPTFDVSIMLDHTGGSMIESWANAARFNSKLGIWYYPTKKDTPDPLKMYYFAGGINQETAEIPPILKWLLDHSKLLGKLKINSDNAYINSATSEEDFLQKVVELWINQKDELGRGKNQIGMVFPGNVVFCGTIDDTKALLKLDEERQHLTQVGNIEKDYANPGKYMIIMENSEGTKYLFNVTIDPEAKTYEVDFIKNTVKADNALQADDLIRQTSELLLGVKLFARTKLEKLKNPPAMQKIVEKLHEVIDSYFDEFTLTNPPTEYELALAISEAFEGDDRTLKQVAGFMGKDRGYFSDLEALKQELEKEENADQENDSNEKIDLCPISLGVKKFM